MKVEVKGDEIEDLFAEIKQTDGTTQWQRVDAAMSDKCSKTFDPSFFAVHCFLINWLHFVGKKAEQMRKALADAKRQETNAKQMKAAVTNAIQNKEKRLAMSVCQCPPSTLVTISFFSYLMLFFIFYFQMQRLEQKVCHHRILSLFLLQLESNTLSPRVYFHISRRKRKMKNRRYATASYILLIFRLLSHHRLAFSIYFLKSRMPMNRRYVFLIFCCYYSELPISKRTLIIFLLDWR